MIIMITKISVCNIITLGSWNLQLKLCFPLFFLRYYDNYQIGTFVLYKSNRRPFEVHVRQWECGSLVHAASCVCGFVVKDEGVVIAFDMCDGEMGETKPHISVKSRHTSQSSFRISESYQGRKVTVSQQQPRSIVNSLK